jgi:2-polyprenyl-3-methyl-5-hydroxy-6-metoxy-1,4-benzoquinol methylase
MVHHIVCPVCSSGKAEIHLRCTDHFLTKEVFTIFRCPDCSFEFTQDYPEENRIGFYYESDDYISHSDTTQGFSNKIYHIARTLMLRRKRGIIRSVTGLNKGTLLDIGSGTGYFAETMKEAGWEVKGVEINKKARDFSIIRSGLEIIDPGQIDSLKTDSFDCITLWHVLEHFHDPFKYATDILRILKPGGICIVALPNCNSYDAKYYRQNWAAFDVPRHLWHFNPVSFNIFSEKSGFATDKLMVLPLDVFYISMLSEKYCGSRLPFLAGVIKAVPFAFLSLFNKKRCSSVVFILRKPD